MGVNDCDCVDIGAIIGTYLVVNPQTSRVSFYLSTTIAF